MRTSICSRSNKLRTQTWPLRRFINRQPFEALLERFDEVALAFAYICKLQAHGGSARYLGPQDLKRGFGGDTLKYFGAKLRIVVDSGGRIRNTDVWIFHGLVPLRGNKLDGMWLG
jgi:hypothetical protein